MITLKNLLSHLKDRPFAFYLGVLLFSVSLAGSIYIYYLQTPTFSRTRLALAVLIGLVALPFIGGVALCIYRPLKRTQLLSYLAVSLTIAVLLWISTLTPRPLNLTLPDHSVEVLLEGEEINGVPCGDLHIRGISNGLSYLSYDGLEKSGDWVRKGTELISNAPGSVIRWQGKIDPDFRLILGPSVCGNVVVTLDGDQKYVIPVSDGSHEEYLLIHTFPRPIAAYMITAMFIILSLTGGVFIFFFLVQQINQRIEHKPSLKVQVKDWIFYSLPMLIGWLVVLLALYPGILATDSYSHLEQATTGVFRNAHPILYTLLVTVSVRLFHTPAVALMVQSSVLAVTVAWGLGVLRKAGLPEWLGWVASFVFMVLPFNFSMVNTLWKDIPYSTAVLALSIFLLDTALQRGVNFNKKSVVMAFALLLAAMGLFRHNGLPVAILLGLALPFIYRTQWKRLLMGAVLFVLIVLGINGPVSWMLRVQQTSSSVSNGLMLFQLGAHVVNPQELTPTQQEHFDQFLPLDEWPDHYNCCSINNLSQAIDRQKFDSQTDLNTRYLIDLTLRHPETMLQHNFCANSLIWSVKSKCYTYTNAIEQQGDSYIWTENRMGYNIDSKLPRIGNAIAKYLFESKMDLYNRSFSLRSVIWRPALYLIFLLLGGGSLIVRSKRWFSMLVVFFPVLLHTLILAVTIPAQDARYQYPMVLVGLFSLLFLFTNPGRGE